MSFLRETLDFRLKHRSVHGDSCGPRAGYVARDHGCRPKGECGVNHHTRRGRRLIQQPVAGIAEMDEPVLERRSSLSCGDLERQQRPFSRKPKPQERDRLKHVGRHGVGHTVKVAKNGEGGSARGWKPATRNLYSDAMIRLWSHRRFGRPRKALLGAKRDPTDSKRPRRHAMAHSRRKSW